MPRPRKFVEEDVVASAGAAFAQKGYGGMTLDALLEATGLGKQSLYNSFGGKRELFLRALAAETEEAVATVDRALSDDGDSPLNKIRKHLIRLAIAFSDGEAKGSLFTKATVELADHDSEVARSSLDAYTALKTIYRGCIVDAKRAGEVADDADEEALAAFFLALTRGMEVLGGAGVGRQELTSIALTSIGIIPTSTVTDA